LIIKKFARQKDLLKKGLHILKNKKAFIFSKTNELGMSCIVVSDVHLGSKSCNYKQFCEFLKWVRKLENQEEPIKCEDKKVAITSPEKFILLGDILELWDPEDGDRDNVVRQSIRPFSLLSDIGCEKIYVIGNHDDAIHMYDEKIDYETRMCLAAQHQLQHLKAVKPLLRPRCQYSH